MTTDPSAEVIRLPPLTRAAVAQLVESRLAGVPDPVFVDACLRATRGTPFLVRVLVDALSEGGIAPTAEAARHVERIGARTVGRSIRLRLRRLPEHAGRLARALAVLEQSDLLQAARLAGLDESEAADAAELLVTAGILESGRPLTFIHPIVRSGIYSELSERRARTGPSSCRPAARRATGRVRARRASTCWPASPPAMAGSSSGSSRPPQRRRSRARPSRQAAFLRRALAEPPPPGDRSALLLDLGMAEASAGLADWLEHLKGAVDAAPDAAAAADATMVLATALSRAQRFAEAVEVLDRARRRSMLATPSSRSSSRLRPLSPAMNDPDDRTLGRRPPRGVARAGRDAQPAPPELLAAAAFSSVLSNEPAEVGAELATRALLAGRRRLGGLRRHAMVLLRNLVLAGDVLAALGRAL